MFISAAQARFLAEQQRQQRMQQAQQVQQQSSPPHSNAAPAPPREFQSLVLSEEARIIMHQTQTELRKAYPPYYR